MQLKHCFFVLLLFAFSAATAQTEGFSITEASKKQPSLDGKASNQDYLYVTAGDRLYAIGNQQGNFPSVGFHIPGEMGGIWQHPIKLLNGFGLAIRKAGSADFHKLEKADHFKTYPFTTSFSYELPDEGLSITRTQFVPDATPVLVVEYAIHNNGQEDAAFNLLFNATINLLPTWLGDRAGMIDGKDELASADDNKGMYFIKDHNNTWFAGIAVEGAKTNLQKQEGAGNTLNAAFASDLRVRKNRTAYVRYFISGSINNAREAGGMISIVRNDLARMFFQKAMRYEVIARQAHVSIPDTLLQQAYEWGKYNSDWLVRDVPGMGRAMSAGLPDYPWFFSNDQAYTFRGLTGTMQPSLFYSSWKMLKQLSDKTNNGNGRIMHEASTNGAVYDKGRMEESQLHIIAAWHIFKWTGDLDFLKENYAYGKKTWDWLQQHDTNKNGYIEGYGGVEIEGLNEEMLDVQVHTQKFLACMSAMARQLSDEASAQIYAQKADYLKSKINTEWWLPEEGRYADFITSRGKALTIIDTALSKRVHTGRNEWARKKLSDLRRQIADGSYRDKGYAVYYNTPGILPAETGIVDTARAREMFKKLSFFTNKFGLYIAGIERPDDISTDEGSFAHDSTFTYNRAVMTIATSTAAIAACKYGLADTALAYIHKILNTFGYATPGTTYEVSPDYGMFVQAWNTTGINIPLIQYFFGIDPDAYNKQIAIRPLMPSKWNKASIGDVIIGDARLSFDYSRNKDQTTYMIKINKEGWTINVALPAGVRAATVNGVEQQAKDGMILLDKNNNVVVF
ncbi:hypothetical protein QTN47_23075 [Danxiaibacter flavus]|uniref:Alpha-L-rhamnosidase six-hairpin glycosidase domain-containing protein n=1 Tax=Danxiaibacter flavus TaxID=3049108 RepID=A0ABV3ZKQ3_9BACT|nr:hypothetical protein QNM32_23080 [Chitinophagaceae bacterium DXS]